MSVQVDRAALADITQPAAIAREILRQNPGLALPIPIEEIAGACGITDIDDVPVTSFEGALVAPDHKANGHIFVRSGMQPERRRFTIGHELGHFLNIWHVPPNGRFECSTRDMRIDADVARSDKKLKWEHEANAFAIEMLIPRALFAARLRSLKEPGLEHIVELASSFGMSKVATARRLLEIADDFISAFVVTKDGTLQWSFRNRRFPFVSIRSGQQIHRKSPTSMFAGASGDCSSTHETELAYWCDTAPPSIQAYEQVLVQESGYRLTMLTLDADDLESGDDESWNPQFR